MRPAFRRSAPSRGQLSPHRRILIAKVKLAQKELGLGDDDYRAILLRVTGRVSATECSEAELVAVLDEFRAKGWQARPRKVQSRAADHRGAMKSRALWISLYHLNAIDDASEEALEAFARRQLKCSRLQWADQGLMYKLIEALKEIGERHGWDQRVERATDASHRLKIVKMRLCEAILNKLKDRGYAAQSWNLAGAACQIVGLEAARAGGPMSWELGELDLVASKLGALLRTGKREN